MPLDAQFNAQFTRDIDQLRSTVMSGLDLDRAAGRTEHITCLVQTITDLLADIVGAMPSPASLTRPRPQNAPRFERTLTRVPDMTETRNRALGMFPDVPRVDDPVIDYTPKPNRLKSWCAHPTADGNRSFCLEPIVRAVAASSTWWHSGNTDSAAAASAHHSATFRNDCTECPPSNPFWQDSEAHLAEHRRDIHGEAI